MNTEIINNELIVLEDEDVEQEVFHYSQTLAGHTITIPNDYEIDQAYAFSNHIIIFKKKEVRP